MSKIEVDAIDKQSGSTLTLGGSGTAVTLASGATQTGFGRTGTVDWQTTPKTATFTAVSGEGYFANTSGSAFNMNLPAGVAGAIVSVADYAATFDSNSLTVVPNGSDKIGSQNENATLSTKGQSVTFVFVDSTQGWINTMDSTSNVRGSSFITATVSGSGNTLVTAPDCANAKIATFTGPGTFCVSQASSCAANNVVSYVIVAGGGGGSRSGSGGGGAGGFREVESPVTAYAASPLDGYPSSPNRITVSATAFPITVGAGGAGGGPPTYIGGSGGVSTFSTITSAGGGGAGSRSSTPRDGIAGGSGGGGGGSCGSTHPGGAGNTPPTTPSQGFPGGAGAGPSGTHAGGGGGGAGAAGALAPGANCTAGGAGGAGVSSAITSAIVARAGGGGGSGRASPGSSAGGAGGTGGGGTGQGCGTTVSAGTTNTGGGGGGAEFLGPIGGAGGSGIVIIRYKFQ